MKYYLGVDVGGTKTHALIADELGVAVGFGEAGPGNHEVVGYEGLAGALRECTQAALEQARLEIQQISAGGFGIAGYDWPSEKESTLNAIAVLGLNASVEVVNDTVVGLLAGASKGWGVAVDAGTGENCWGRDRSGWEAHMTGSGSIFGEYGGAGSLVEQAMRSISLAWGLRGPTTRLTQAFIEATGASSPDDLLEGLSQARYWVDNSLAPTVFKVAREGDEVAKGIVTWAGCELASMVNGIARQLKFEGEVCQVVMIGGMFKNSDILVEPFKTEVCKVLAKAQFIRLEEPPAMGGVILAMQQTGLKVSEAIRRNLTRSINSLHVTRKQG